MTSIEEFNSWLKKNEDLRFEFKEARNQFSKDRDLPDYCAALANEGGGKLVLGVDDRAKKVVGSKAFQGTHHKLSIELLQKLKIRVDIEELHHPDGRVLIFHVPSRPCGHPVRTTGKYTYPMRAGESLVEMDDSTLKRILNETSPDFSVQIVDALRLADLDETALATFRHRWAQKSQRDDYLSFPPEKLLRNAGLLTDNGLTCASLILLGKKEIIDMLLPCSEIIFEWRQTPDKTAHDFRIAWREPFFKIYDEVWNTLNARNIRIPFQEGLFQREIFAFSEKPVREALLNAVAHRDYTITSQSIFIKASPEQFFIESPGGLPVGITLDNILIKTAWRNRLIAETLEKAEMVERSGQGMDDIFQITIKEGKGMPDLSATDAFSVRLTIPAQVKDKNFILFLERVISQKQVTLSFEEIYALEQIRVLQKVPSSEFKNKFLELGIIEKIGKTRGTKYLLAHKYYVHAGKPGLYTRITGISREKQKELIQKHISKNKKGYRKEFEDIFSELKPSDISNLLRELKKDGKIIFEGSSKNGFWRIA